MREAVDFAELAERGLLAERLDVAHREPAHERADHHRLQRLCTQQLRAARDSMLGAGRRRRFSIPDRLSGRE
jgi:hypothetical protein